MDLASAISPAYFTDTETTRNGSGLVLFFAGSNRRSSCPSRAQAVSPTCHTDTGTFSPSLNTSIFALSPSTVTPIEASRALDHQKGIALAREHPQAVGMLQWPRRLEFGNGAGAAVGANVDAKQPVRSVVLT